MKLPENSEDWVYDVLEILSVHDGDSCALRIDVGFGMYAEQHFRLYGLNTPEMTGTPEYEKSDLHKLAVEAKMYVLNRLNKAIANKQKVEVQVVNQEKFGRWLAVILINGKCVNDELLKRGLAREYYGKGSKDSVWADYKKSGVRK